MKIDFYSILFFLLSAYFTFIWPTSVRKKIEEGTEVAEMEKTVKLVQICAGFIFLACIICTFIESGWSVLKPMLIR